MRSFPFLVIALLTVHVAPVAAARVLDDAPDLRQEIRELEIAEHKLRVAESSLELAQLSARTGVHFAERELEMARFERERFEAMDRPRRIAEKELQLQRARDRAQEAADELKQIELMYAEQDLDDKTAEFVVSRGRRAAERSARDLELQEQELKAFVSFELRKQADALGLAVERKEVELEKARRSADNDVLQRKIGVMEARARVEGLQESLAKKKAAAAEAKAAPEAPEKAAGALTPTGDAGACCEACVGGEGKDPR